MLKNKSKFDCNYLLDFSHDELHELILKLNLKRYKSWHINDVLTELLIYASEVTLLQIKKIIFEREKHVTELNVKSYVGT